MRVWYLMAAVFTVATFAFGQRLEGWDVRTESGTRFDALIGSGLNSFQWGQLRGSENVPPRTSRHAYIRNIRVIDGGDPFGRVVVLWSGWEGNGGDRAEYWIRSGYKVPPVYEAAQVGRTWSGNDLFRIRLWNEQYFSWQERRAVVSVYAANAPVPALVSHTPPTWTDLSGATKRAQNRLGTVGSIVTSSRMGWRICNARGIASSTASGVVSRSAYTPIPCASCTKSKWGTSSPCTPLPG